jgi:hypothetical protein
MGAERLPATFVSEYHTTIKKAVIPHAVRNLSICGSSVSGRLSGRNISIFATPSGGCLEANIHMYQYVGSPWHRTRTWMSATSSLNSTTLQAKIRPLQIHDRLPITQSTPVWESSSLAPVAGYVSLDHDQ